MISRRKFFKTLAGGVAAAAAGTAVVGSGATVAGPGAIKPKRLLTATEAFYRPEKLDVIRPRQWRLWNVRPYGDTVEAEWTDGIGTVNVIHPASQKTFDSLVSQMIGHIEDDPKFYSTIRSLRS